jgi:hypothetical protein
MTTRSFFGAALIAVGGLVALLCGLCTLTYFVMGASSLGKGGEEGAYGPIMMIASVLMGGAPTAIGVGLVLAGRAMRKP